MSLSKERLPHNSHQTEGQDSNSDMMWAESNNVSLHTCFSHLQLYRCVKE